MPVVGYNVGDKVVAALFWGERMELEDDLEDPAGNITNEKFTLSMARCTIPWWSSYTKLSSPAECRQLDSCSSSQISFSLLPLAWTR